MNKSRTLLLALTVLVPPRGGTKHMLFIGDKRDLTVSLSTTEPEGYEFYTIEDTDLSKNGQELALEIYNLHRLSVGQKNADQEASVALIIDRLDPKPAVATIPPEDSYVCRCASDGPIPGCPFHAG